MTATQLRAEGRQLRILFVDDDEEWARSQGAVLTQRYGAVVDYAKFPEVASERVEHFAYDVVVVDIWFGDGKQRGDEWLLRKSEYFTHSVKVLFSADETRGRNWEQLRELGVLPLRKLSHEDRFQDMIGELAKRSRPTQTEEQPLTIRVTPEEAAVVLSRTWEILSRWESLLAGGGSDDHWLRSKAQIGVSVEESAVHHQAWRLVAVLLAELAVGCVGVIWVFGLSFWLAALLFAIIGASAAIWQLTVWSWGRQYTVSQRTGMIIAAIVLVAELALLLSKFVQGG
jgi:hypothetical protein